MSPRPPQTFDLAHWRREFTRAEQFHHLAETWADRLLERVTDDLHPFERELLRRRAEAARVEAWAWATYADDAETAVQQHEAEAAEMCPGPCGRPEWMCGCAEQLERRTRYDDLTLGRLDRLDRGMDVA